MNNQKKLLDYCPSWEQFCTGIAVVGMTMLFLFILFMIAAVQAGNECCKKKL